MSKLLNSISELRHFVFHEIQEIIIDLSEAQSIPKYRFPYMATTGLFYDMMPHALIPLQMLFAGIKVKCEPELLCVGQYLDEDGKSYKDMVEAWATNQGVDQSTLRCETYFSIMLKLTLHFDKKPTRKINCYIRSASHLT